MELIDLAMACVFMAIVGAVLFQLLIRGPPNEGEANDGKASG